MIITFKVMNGPFVGKEFQLPAPKCLIGRAPECYVRLNGEAVSRHHCTVYVQDGHLYVRDMNSRNGTFVNGSLIASDCELKNEDQLRVGSTVFEVHLVPMPHRTEKSETFSKNIPKELLSFRNATLSDSKITNYLGDAETRPLKIEDSSETTIVQPPTTQPEQSGEEKLGMPPQSPVSHLNNSQFKIPGSWSQKKRSSSTESAADEALKRYLRGQ
jgi:pSer/pThr/pTyr-binding forkhead associated (FHA) protein